MEVSEMLVGELTVEQYIVILGLLMIAMIFALIYFSGP